MARIDVITKYHDLLDSGVPEAQARLHAMHWAESMEPHTDLATKSDFLLLKADLFWIKVIGGAIFTICCFPILSKFLVH